MNGPNWAKAPDCADSTCVEVAMLPDGRWGMRDSKDPAGEVLAFSGVDWAALAAAAKNGELRF